MKFVHGPLVMEVEEGWEDHSKIAFAEPPDRSIAHELAKRAASSGAPIHLQDPGLSKPRTNFVLSSRPAPLGVDEKQFVENELAAMLSLMPTLQRGEMEWCPLGEGSEAATMAVEINFEEGSTLMQFHALGILAGRLLHFCGTSTPGSYKKVRDRFLGMLASIRLEGPEPEGRPRAEDFPGAAIVDPKVVHDHLEKAAESEASEASESPEDPDSGSKPT